MSFFSPIATFLGTERATSALGSHRLQKIFPGKNGAMKHSNEAAKLQALIDENLKKVYQEALDEKIPDKFKDLLEQLRKKDDKK